MTKDMIVKAAQEAAARRNEVFALNDLRVDLTARRVWKNGKSVRLTPREYALLERSLLTKLTRITWRIKSGILPC